LSGFRFAWAMAAYVLRWVCGGKCRARVESRLSITIAVLWASLIELSGENDELLASQITAFLWLLTSADTALTRLLASKSA
jgi:hypothetical protein